MNAIFTHDFEEIFQTFYESKLLGYYNFLIFKWPKTKTIVIKTPTGLCKYCLENKQHHRRILPDRYI